MSNDPPRALGGPEKAALFLLAVDEEVASQIIAHFDEDDVRRVAASAERLAPVSTSTISDAFEEFARRMREPQLPRGAGAYMKRLAAVSLGDDRARRIFPPPPPGPHPLEALRAARTNQLAELLLEEHPQVATVVLSQLGREQAAEVVRAMPAERQVDLIRRLSLLSEVPEQMALLASEALAKALAAAGAIGGTGERTVFDGVSFAASLLNEMGPAESDQLLEGLQQVDDKIAPKVREAMFTFEDLSRLAGRGLQLLMREIQTEQLLVALKTATEELREKFMSAVSSRAATAMREDLEALPPTRLSDVEKAQREILDTAMRLVAEGKLTLPGRGGDKLV